LRSCRDDVWRRGGGVGADDRFALHALVHAFRGGERGCAGVAWWERGWSARWSPGAWGPLHPGECADPWGDVGGRVFAACSCGGGVPHADCSLCDGQRIGIVGRDLGVAAVDEAGPGPPGLTGMSIFVRFSAAAVLSALLTRG